jgi:hypothetical protein
MNKDKILSTFNYQDNNIKNIYAYGSRVYKTNSETSDYDFIIISDFYENDFALEKNNISIHVFSVEQFQNQINDHKISALECLFLDNSNVLKQDHQFNFVLNKSKLRSSISEKSSHAWVKAKKKFEVEKDQNFYIAKKSLFHSLRIIDFGLQIAKNNKIVDYSSSNDIWLDIITDPENNWDHYKNKYQNLFNERMSEFRKVAPK